MPRLAVLPLLSIVVLYTGCAAAPSGEAAAAPADPVAPVPAAAPADPVAPAPAAAPIAASGRCEQNGYVTPAGARLELSASVDHAVLTVRLHNAGTEAVCVYSHIATHEWQHDWLTVAVDDPARPRLLTFSDDRDKSAPVSILIGPGHSDVQTVDLAAWARRSINGGVALPAGAAIGEVVYDSSREASVWAGRLAVVPTTGAASRPAP